MSGKMQSKLLSDGKGGDQITVGRSVLFFIKELKKSFQHEGKEEICPRPSEIFIFFVSADKQIPAGFPSIIQNPGMKVVEKGRNAVLVCEAGGDPSPTITWIKDTMPVNLSKPRISMIEQGKLRDEAATRKIFSQSSL